ncbi:unnamed protein product [Clavelina lepadiformis]|uniref:Uncharacterized protein n=1 Tax=Clavelina lepadiformis TaxID=159417 RepID=A0ABP0FV06_CLALP
MSFLQHASFSGIGGFSTVPRSNGLKKRKKKQNVPMEIEEMDAEDIKKQNQRYMDVLRDLTRLRDHYYSVYLSKLEAKVDKQRKELAAREEALKKKLLKEEKRKVKEAHVTSRRLPKHVLKNDIEFLRNIPKSHYYHLVAVEKLMKSRGLLQQRFELEDFWKKVKADQNFWTKPVHPALSPDTLTEHMLSRYSSLTANSKMDSHTSFESETNAVNTITLPGILKSAMKSNSDDADSPRSETPPIVFPPPPEFPKLHSFKLKLPLSYKSAASVATTDTGTEKDNISSSLKPVKKHRQKHEHFIRREAYDVAVVKTAMSGRMLGKHRLNIGEHQSLSEITELWCSSSEKSSVISSKEVTNTMSKFKKNAKTSIPQNFKQVVQNVDEIRLDPITELPLQEENDKKHLPLSMQMMVEKEKVTLLEAHCPSAVWVNYAYDDCKTNTPVFRNKD